MELKIVILLPLIILLMLVSASAEKITAEGELIDTVCYLGMKASGEDHKLCAAMCAKKGLPIALLTKKGNVINIISIPAEFEDVMGNIVKFEGEFYKNAQSMKPTKMWVKKDGKWKEHELTKTGM